MDAKTEKRLKEFCLLKDGWFYDAGVVPPVTVQRAIQCLSLLDGQRPYPFVVPISLGVTFEYGSPCGTRYLQVDWFEDSTYIIAVSESEGEFERSRIYFADTLHCVVADLKKWIDWVFELQPTEDLSKWYERYVKPRIENHNGA